MSTLQRGEQLALAILLTAGVLVAGVFYAYSSSQEHSAALLEEQAVDKAEKAFSDAEKTVPMGQVASLTAENTQQVALWATGTKEFTVTRAMLFSSLQEAAADEELGNVVEAIPPDGVADDAITGNAGARLLVLEVSIHNIDAKNDGDAPYEFLIESDISLNCSNYCLATFSGSPLDAGPKQINTYTLAPGESETYLIGFWIGADEDPDTLTVGIGNNLGIYGVAPITVELDIDDKTR